MLIVMPVSTNDTMTALNSKTTLPSISFTSQTGTSDHLSTTDSSHDEPKRKDEKEDPSNSTSTHSDMKSTSSAKRAVKTTATPKRTYKKKKTEGKRKKPTQPRAPRRVIPECKDYIPENTPTTLDVVAGRGGKSNHHPGNRPYWIKILQERGEYRLCVDDDSKRQIAQSIVTSIHNRGGRFLQMEITTERWFVLPAKVVLDKVKQALRDRYVPLWARREYGILDNDGEEKEKTKTNRSSSPEAAPSAASIPRNRDAKSSSSKRIIKQEQNQVAGSDKKKKSPLRTTKPQSQKPATVTKKAAAKRQTKRAPKASKKADAQQLATKKKQHAKAAKKPRPQASGERKATSLAMYPAQNPRQEESPYSQEPQFDDLMEVIGRDMPDLAFGNDAAESSAVHSLAPDTNRYWEGCTSPPRYGDTGFFSGDQRAALSGDLTFGGENVRSVDMVGDMIHRWDQRHHGAADQRTIGSQGANESIELQPPDFFWNGMFTDALGQPTDTDQV